MFISRIPLNTARYEGHQLLSSPYKLHSAVEHCFPPVPDAGRSEGRILWRVDVSQERKAVWLYVVSPLKPDFTHIIEQAGWPLYHEWECKDYSPLLNSLTQGQHWRFRLRANPVHKVPSKPRDGAKDALAGSIQGHVTVAQQEQWLLNRAGKHGFRILTDHEVPQVAVAQRQKQRFLRQGKTVTLNTAQFDGVLEVIDAGAFRSALCNGIGRAKGFGCGLLTISQVLQRDTTTA
ncbi:CRISPR-associated protein, Cse3 family [Bifidobacterium actinocoloniiforme DSM 22766]|uniref:CRISPR-associated protein, Cse3 family n=1 Tax=Bifidobacterium actinocoloniiforme DSM 22766 TaxID=1437605 RepID=A0A086YYJ2_9BIFI|nr:type I-E CRISPR-associated protein Cas6/Cse3/CasE [Bifidobacterium actinocoloniiforme]AKV55876.1 CRISPR-associated protein Cse3 [Bifidobacterium actinocoloniiforme DSM 22766]KFI39342.1 CRISPR-associated protein, Cse3 family [Bifidobacterium actinocoloniiforme DSM 22766]